MQLSYSIKQLIGVLYMWLTVSLIIFCMCHLYLHQDLYVWVETNTSGPFLAAC